MYAFFFAVDSILSSSISFSATLFASVLISQYVFPVLPCCASWYCCSVQFANLANSELYHLRGSCFVRCPQNRGSSTYLQARFCVLILVSALSCCWKSSVDLRNVTSSIIRRMTLSKGITSFTLGGYVLDFNPKVSLDCGVSSSSSSSSPAPPSSFRKKNSPSNSFNEALSLLDESCGVGRSRWYRNILLWICLVNPFWCLGSIPLSQ